jgi:hypothetical protein
MFYGTVSERFLEKYGDGFRERAVFTVDMRFLLSGLAQGSGPYVRKRTHEGGHNERVGQEMEEPGARLKVAASQSCATDTY